MASGTQVRAAFTREADTGVKLYPALNAATATSDNLLPLNSEAVDFQADQQSLVTRGRPSLPNAPRVLRQSVEGNVTLNMTYEDLVFWLTCCLGVEVNQINGITLPEELVAGTVYRHLIEVDDDIKQLTWESGDGFICGDAPTGSGLFSGQKKLRRGTLSVDKGIGVWDTRSAMLQGFTLQASPQAVLLSTEVIGYDIDYNSVINAALPQLTCPVFTQLRFSELKFYLRVRGTGAINRDTDEIAPLTGLQLNFANALRGSTRRGRGGGLSEPQRGTTALVTGSFARPILRSNTLLLQNQANTEMVALAEFTGPIITGTSETLTLRLWMPSFFYTGADAGTFGADQLTENFAFTCVKPVDTPAGFPANSQGGSLMVELINTDARHPLLD